VIRSEPMRTVDIGGLRIAYELAGEGPPLVLLHGVLADSRIWRRQLEALSAEFTVVAWDAPGCGQSSDPPETFALRDYADCLAAFIGALGLERPHVLGLSWGGGLALQLYERRPALPRTLILAAAYAGWSGSLPADVVAARLTACLREAELPPSQFVPGWIPGLLTAAAPAELVDEVVQIMSEFHPMGYRVMIRGFAEADLRHVLPSIDVPTLLLYGDADKRAPLSIAQELHAKIARSRLAILRGIGHLSNVEAPGEFNAEVRHFLHPCVE
jgi:pimeloyl-ACP methyl ester carboxylesterase